MQHSIPVFVCVCVWVQTFDCTVRGCGQMATKSPCTQTNFTVSHLCKSKFGLTCCGSQCAQPFTLLDVSAGCYHLNVKSISGTTSCLFFSLFLLSVAVSTFNVSYV